MDGPKRNASLRRHVDRDDEIASQTLRGDEKGAWPKPDTNLLAHVSNSQNGFERSHVAL